MLNQLVTDLTKLQADLRTWAEDNGPTDQLALADNHLSDAAGALTRELLLNEMTPEQRRIAELEAENEQLRRRPAGRPPDNVPVRKGEIREPGLRRPRGMQRFATGHTKGPDADSFEPTVPAPPPQAFAPGQGSGRLKQAEITGQGESASEALARADRIAREG